MHRRENELCQESHYRLFWVITYARPVTACSTLPTRVHLDNDFAIGIEFSSPAVLCKYLPTSEFTSGPNNPSILRIHVVFHICPKKSWLLTSLLSRWRETIISDWWLPRLRDHEIHGRISVCLFAYIHDRQSVSQFVRLSVCLSARMYVYLSIYLSVCLHV